MEMENGQMMHSENPAAVSFEKTVEKAAEDEVKRLIEENNIIMFSKSYCPYCKSSKQILSSAGANYKVVEIDKIENRIALDRAIKKYSKQGTVPNIYISGRHIGGDSDLKKLQKSGELQRLLKEAME